MPRKAHKYHYLYKIMNTKNNKYYIGMHSTSNLEDGYMGGGVRIRNSIRYHGLEVHEKEILEFFDDRESLANAEEKMVNVDLLNDSMCMNLMEGGENKFSRETAIRGNKKAVERIKFLYKNNPEWVKRIKINLSKGQKKAIIEGRRKNYNTFGSKTHSTETKEKMRIAASKRTENKNSHFGKCWIYNNELKESKSINKEELDSYLALGWIKGRKMKF